MTITIPTLRRILVGLPHTSVRLDACNHEMRGNTNCAMDPGHRGRHSSVVFQCDSCDKRRRGYPEVDDPDAGVFCFMCVRVYHD